MITARQTRAARALLGWNQETLAEKAVVSLTALKRMESVNDLRVHESTRDQVRRALEFDRPRRLPAGRHHSVKSPCYSEASDSN
ncbi:multiprotein-bridging factor 1 family protein [Bosea sp. TAB14]